MDASPCSSLSDSISLDERCPEFVCIDNEEVSGVETIKWRTNSLYIPDDLEIGLFFYMKSNFSSSLLVCLTATFCSGFTLN